MEYIDGLDLGQFDALAAVSSGNRVMVLLQSIKGLNTLINWGIIHCNIKPGNILISKTGKVKIADLRALTMRVCLKPNSMNLQAISYSEYMPPKWQVEPGPEHFNGYLVNGLLAYHIICGTFLSLSEFSKACPFDRERRCTRCPVRGPTLPDDLATESMLALKKIPSDRPASVDRLIVPWKFLYDLGVGELIE